MKLWRAAAGELLGTAILTFMACGADVVASANHDSAIVVRAVAPALTITALIWGISGISGAHLNPAVTLAFTVRERFPYGAAAVYLIAQFVGAVFASLAIAGLVGNIQAGAPHPTGAYSASQAFGAEIALSFFLIFTILATAEQKAVVGKNVALAVGGVIAASGFAFLPVSGAAINPARALGPMIVAGDLRLAWLYCLAPVLGAALAVLAARVCLGPPR